MFDPDDATFAPMLKRERERLVAAILKRAEKANSVELIHLSSLGEAVGVEDAQLAKWRVRAASARRDMSKMYRDKYSDYRMRAAVAPDAPETLAVLDDMIALGLEDNSYHQWALREKARVQGKKGKSKENANENANENAKVDAKGDAKENAKGNVK